MTDLKDPQIEARKSYLVAGICRDNDKYTSFHMAGNVGIRFYGKTKLQFC